MTKIGFFYFILFVLLICGKKTWLKHKKNNKYRQTFFYAENQKKKRNDFFYLIYFFLTLFFYTTREYSFIRLMWKRTKFPVLMNDIRKKKKRNNLQICKCQKKSVILNSQNVAMWENCSKINENTKRMRLDWIKKNCYENDFSGLNLSVIMCSEFQIRVYK